MIAIEATTKNKVGIHMHSINFYNFEERKDYKQGIEGSGENCPE